MTLDFHKMIMSLTAHDRKKNNPDFSKLRYFSLIKIKLMGGGKVKARFFSVAQLDTKEDVMRFSSILYSPESLRPSGGTVKHVFPVLDNEYNVIDLVPLLNGNANRLRSTFNLKLVKTEVYNEVDLKGLRS